jgi:hypothetical protein
MESFAPGAVFGGFATYCALSAWIISHWQRRTS